ncbi:MAG: hypothetical protein WAW86_05380 [Gammaproteobacteria bacterium]
MSANFVLFSQLNFSPERASEITRIWHNFFGSDKNKYCLYMPYKMDTNSLLMITNIESKNDAFSEIQNDKFVMFENSIRDHLCSDWRHQVLSLEESIKHANSLLPESLFLQLRHIEVPLNVYSEYLSWRRDTIFAHVKKQDEIEFFLSYHSVISTEPGVMFLSGFSCSPEIYLNLFNNEGYKKIVKEAGDKYITGGEKGLYTSLYQRASII